MTVYDDENLRPLPPLPLKISKIKTPYRRYLSRVCTHVTFTPTCVQVCIKDYVYRSPSVYAYLTHTCVLFLRLRDGCVGGGNLTSGQEGRRRPEGRKPRPLSEIPAWEWCASV